MLKFHLFFKRKTVNVICNGCSRRVLDSEKIKNYFQKNNYKIVEGSSNADYVVFVTCAFTQQREDESIKIIEKLKKGKGELIVAGCLPDIAKENFTNVFNGRYVSTKNMDKFGDLFDSGGTQFTEVPDSNFVPISIPSLLSIINVRSFFNKFSLNSLRLLTNGLISKAKLNNKNEYFLRIGFGCLGNCSYCGIKNAIGTHRSKSINTVLEEFKTAVVKGYKRVNIISDDVGAYGLDINESFPKLIREILKEANYKDIRLKIKELHPMWIIKYSLELIDLIKTNKIIYILSGIQSGSDRILKLMKRHHSSNQIISVLKQIKMANSKVWLSAQIIVGFPSETNEEFIATLNLLKSVRFDEVTIFPYTDRLGTKSIEMQDKISDEVKMDRIKIALKILKEAKIKCYADCLN